MINPLSTKGKEPEFRMSPLEEPIPDSESQINNITDELEGDIPESVHVDNLLGDCRKVLWAICFGTLEGYQIEQLMEEAGIDPYELLYKVSAFTVR